MKLCEKKRAKKDDVVDVRRMECERVNLCEKKFYCQQYTPKG